METALQNTQVGPGTVTPTTPAAKVASTAAASAGTAGAPGAVAPVSSTPGYASSTSVAGEFANNSTTLAGKTTPAPIAVPAYGSDVKDANGNVIGKALYDPNTGKPLANPNAETGNPKVDANGNPIAAPVTKPTAPTDPNVMWDAQDAAAQKAADDAKVQAATMLATNLANVDQAYASSVASITSKWNDLIDTQNKIDTQTLAMARAYGIANGAQYTPIETQVAIGDKETAIAANIKSLDSQRDAELQSALTAKNTGDAAALQQNMENVEKIESDMQTQLKNISDEINAKYDTANKVYAQQVSDYNTSVANFTSKLAATYWQEFQNATTPEEKQALITKLMNENGVDPSNTEIGVALYSALGNTAATNTKNTADATKSALDISKETEDIVSTKADVAAKEASTAATYAKMAADSQAAAGTNLDGTPTTSAQTSFYQGAQHIIDNASNGDGTLDSKGYLTADAFQNLVQNGSTHGLSKMDVATKYATSLYLNKNNGGYGLTDAQIAQLKGTQ